MVGKIEIVYSENFRNYLDELAQLLYQKNYFGFIEDVDHYIDKIYDYINNNIDKPIAKKSPFDFQKFGKYYLKYKANNRTFWYIFFDRKENRFLVNHILNNHSKNFTELL